MSFNNKANKIVGSMLAVSMALSVATVPAYAVADGVNDKDLLPTVVSEPSALSEYAAKIEDQNFSTLADAIANVQDGQTIELLGDVEEDGTFNIEKSITIDFGGHKLTGKPSSTGYFVVKSVGDITVTIRHGSFEVTGSSKNAIEVKNKVDLTLEDLNITAAGNSSRALSASMTKSRGSVINVLSGTYTANGQFPISSMSGIEVSLAKGVVITSTSSSSYLSPSAMVGMDMPATLPEGCFADVKKTEEGRTLTIREGVAPFLEGDNGFYSTLQEALDAGEETVYMMTDGGSAEAMLEPVTIPANKTLTINMNPNRYSADTLYYYGNIHVEGTLGLYGNGTETGFLGDITFDESGTTTVHSTYHYLILKSDIRDWLPNGYGLTRREVDDVEYWYLDSATIKGKTGTMYATIHKAIEAGETEITLTKDHAENIDTTGATKPITIDLANFTLKGAVNGKVAAVTVAKDTELTIKNGTLVSGPGYFMAEEYCVENHGTVTLDNVTVNGVNASQHIAGGPASNISRNALIRSDGTLNINGGHISNTLMLAPNTAPDGIPCDGGIGVLVYGGTAKLDNVYIYAGYNGVYVSAGKVDISGSQTRIEWAGNSMLPPAENGRTVCAVDAASPDLISITGGKYNSNVSKYVAKGYVAKDATGSGDSCEVIQLSDNNASEVVSSALRVIFLKDIHNETGNKYEIVIETATDGTAVYGFQSADLTFELTNAEGGEIEYKVVPAENIELQQDGDKFTFKYSAGDDALSGNRIVIGSVIFSGFGEADFKCNANAANTVVTMDFKTKGDQSFTAADETHTLTVNPSGVEDSGENVTVYGTLKIKIKTVAVPAGETYERDGVVYKAADEQGVVLEYDDNGSITVKGPATVTTKDGVVYESTSEFQLTPPSDDAQGSITVTDGTVDVTFTEEGSISVNGNALTATAEASVSVSAQGEPSTQEDVRLTGDGQQGYTATKLYPATASGALANGSVSVSPEFAAPGEKVTVTTSPDQDFHTESVTVTDAGGTDVEVQEEGEGKYSFVMPKDGADISAKFVHDPYAITVEELSNGAITVPSEASAGDTVTLTVAPDAGYMLKGLPVVLMGETAIDLEAQEDGTYTFTMPEGAVTVSAEFELIRYETTVPEIEHGSVTFSPEDAAPGETVTLTVTPDPGYELKDLAVTDKNGEPVELEKQEDGTYTFKMNEGGVDVSASMIHLPYSIRLKGITHGMISAPQQAVPDETVTIAVIAVSGYRLDELTVTDSNGSPIQIQKTEDGNYTFTMPYSDVNIFVSVVVRTNGLAIIQPEHGTVTASPKNPSVGDEVTLTVSPNSGYTLDELTVTADNGTSVELKKSGNKYSFTMPEGSIEVIASFTRVYTPAPTPSYKVNVKDDDHGIVSVDSYAYPYDRVTFTVTPDEGYHLKSLTVTNSSGKEIELKLNDNGSYYFTMPYSQVTINAEFVPCASLAFSDLNPNAWYHEYTDYVIDKGLMAGMGNGIFAPYQQVTRAQMVMVLWNMSGTPSVDYLMTYADVGPNSWFTEAIRWATSEGIVSGYSKLQFGSNDPITREQMAVMIYRYEQKYGTGGFTGEWAYRLPFADLDKISDWAFEAVSWCNMKGLLMGKDNNLFDPYGITQRCELAAVLTNYDQLEAEN